MLPSKFLVCCSMAANAHVQCECGNKGPESVFFDHCLISFAMSQLTLFDLILLWHTSTRDVDQIIIYGD